MNDYFDFETILKEAEQERKEEERSHCIQMLISIITYSWRKGETAKVLLSGNNRRYLESYIDSFNIRTITKWCQQLIDNVDYIEYNTYTDCDGCTYNSINFKDENLNNLDNFKW